jgi:hypothetical protein
VRSAIRLGLIVVPYGSAASDAATREGEQADISIEESLPKTC